jgi:hypothetical protein
MKRKQKKTHPWIQSGNRGYAAWQARHAAKQAESAPMKKSRTPLDSIDVIGA